MSPLTIVVTGAAGFIGREVVACARARGHFVRAVIRGTPPTPLEWSDDVETIFADLMNNDALAGALEGADVVVHLAARMSGDAESQQRDTVNATQALCEAIVAQSTIPRIVLISSISVYAHDAVKENGIIDENSPLEATPEKRDGYCLSKLKQEQIARSFHARHAMPLTVLRPGAVYGKGNVWNAHLGVKAGPVLVQFTRNGQLPVIYLRNCAQAILKACENEPITPVNLIDRDPPTRASYLQAIGWKKATIVFPWRLLSWIGALIPFPSKPGLLHPEILQFRMMPVRYATAGLEGLMAGEPLISLDEAMGISHEEQS
jgi:nucleoside-diphosphate-sugar epimerase